jgi:hypothetical protein
MQIKVLHQVRNEITYKVEGFEPVANVFIAKEPININDALEYAYRWTQNIHGSWSMGETFDHCDNGDFNPNVTVVKPLRTWSDGQKMGHRSSSVGDLFVVDGQIYICDSFGFKLYEMEVA